MKTFNESMMEEFYDWEIKGINIGEAISKQIKPDKIPEIEVEDGVDENGKTILFTKPKCPHCGEISYSGKYCQHCGKRLR